MAYYEQLPMKKEWILKTFLTQMFSKQNLVMKYEEDGI